MSATKKKIISAAISLFNEIGVVNTRLQQIADRCGISVGNLAYHYKNKESILKEIYDNLSAKLKEILSKYGTLPSLSDFDQQLSDLFTFMQAYPFYFTDALEMERIYPELKHHRKEFSSKIIAQIRIRMEFNENRGILVKEPLEGVYDIIANSTWMILNSWVTYQILTDIPRKCEGSFKMAVWIQWYPYFTDKGLLEYESEIASQLTHHVI